MLLRINNLARGHSGIKYKTLKLLIDMLNNGVIPWVPEQGSVGASGDLVPLAHMVLVMMGKGRAYYDNELVNGDKALEYADLKPVQLDSKEGLALINGTQMMGALGALAVFDSINLAFHADLALALSLEGLNGILDAYDEDIHKLRPHSGQKRVAANIRQITKGSKLAVYNHKERVQDAYTLRCAPQVHGASRDAIEHVENTITREINSVTDNPLIFPEKKKVLSGGNFHGQPLALTLDYLGMAVSELGNISERRTARMVDGSLNNGLEMFLTPHGGLNSGYMISQYTSASLVAENKVLANPSSTDSIPTSANQEDHVSMGSIGARKARQIVKNVENILAIELITAAQAVDMRTNSPLQKLGKGTKNIYQTIRERVPELKEDRVLYTEVKKIQNMVHNMLLANKVEI
jgi:histidine ammonia-lyase